MKFRVLGKTGLKVSVIGLGTHQFSGEWAKVFSEAEVRQILARAQDCGINFIDTAECYGDHMVESLLGGILAGQRARWIVATKFGHAYPTPTQKADAWSVAEVRRQLEVSLKALKTDYVDIYQFHSGSNECFANEELWTMLNEQVQAGKIRFLGISLAGALTARNDLTQLHAAEKVNARVMQIVYNRLQTQAEKDILPFCERHGFGVLARIPLAKGFLAGGYKPGTVFAQNDNRAAYSNEFNDQQLRRAEEIKQTEVPPGQNMAQWALAWCLKQRAVASAIVGSKSLHQLEINAAAAELIDP
jgi:aryl-alcohol dehydrogenase-like predicted oxidoreductase